MCQRVLGPRYGMKIAFDPRDSGCFILCNEVLHDFMLEHSSVIVNGQYLMSFTRYRYVALYDDDDTLGMEEGD